MPEGADDEDSSDDLGTDPPDSADSTDTEGESAGETTESVTDPDAPRGTESDRPGRPGTADDLAVAAEAANAVDAAVSRAEARDPSTVSEGSGPPTPVEAADITDSGIQDAGDEGVASRGPATDQEMPLEEHIEEMIRRLATVIVAAALVSAIMLPFGDSLITFLWDSILIGTDARPHLYSPLELIITQVKVASLAGLVIALPVLVYQSYRFMRPGLYPHERRYYLAAVPTSLVLAFVGLTFAYFVVLPAVFTYFLRYSEETATIAFGLAPTFNLILILLGYLAIVFQIPLFVMLAMMMGLVTRRWLIQRRLLFWGAFAGISFIFSPDPTGVSPIIIAVTMVALFEGTLFLARWTKSGQRVAGA